jgi:acyl dehydratase
VTLRATELGDTLRAEAEVAGVRASASEPDRRVVQIAYRILNQHGETVSTLRAVQLARRPAASCS